MARVPRLRSPSTSSRGDEQAYLGMEGHQERDYGVKESKVAELEKFSGKKGNEVYRWFVQLQLVFQGKPQT